MGYATTFTGAFAIEPPLGDEGRAAVVRASQGARSGASCAWIAPPDGRSLVWNGADSARDDRAWLEAVITALAAAGHRVAGEVAWRGEDPGDAGVLVARDGTLTVERPGRELDLGAVIMRLRDLDPAARRAARDELARLLWDRASAELLALYVEPLATADVPTTLEILGTLASMLATGHLREADVASLFHRAAEDRDERVRAQAAAALERVADAEAVLQRLLVDPSPLVQGKANHALHRRRTRPR